MRWAWGVVAWMIGGLAVVDAGAQGVDQGTVPMTGTALKSRLESVFKDKRLPIRDFLAEPVIRYHWQNDHLEHDAEKTFMYGIFTLQSVEVTPASGPVELVVLKGFRGTLLKDGKGGYGVSSVKEAERFEVDLRGARGDLSALIAGQLFYSSVLVQLSAVPPYLSGPVEVTPGVHKALAQADADAPMWIADAEVWKQVPRSEVTMPKVSLAPQAKFTEQARNAGMSGIAEAVLIVSATGGVDGVWIDRPLGFGLNASVLEAAFRYRFTPATYQGRGVGTPLRVEMAFASQ